MKNKNIIIEWQVGPVEAEITIAYGKLNALKILRGKGRVQGRKIEAAGPLRLECRIVDANLAAGAYAARLAVSGKPHSFACFVRDINREHPVYIPDYNVIVTESTDKRSYTEVEAAICSQGLRGKQQQI